jgi:hypothetical protein
MQISTKRYGRDAMAALSLAERDLRLRELEILINPTLQTQPTLEHFQRQLYAIIEQLTAIGHFLGPWEYDSEIEYWGGKSYMDRTLDDELLLRSEFHVGIRFAWRDFELLQTPAP